MGTKQQSPKTVTIYGRLSFPTWTAEEAYQRSLKGDYPAASAAEAKPDFNLLVEEAQLNKLRTKIIDEFLPNTKVLLAEGNKKAGFTDKEIDMLLAQINDPDFAGVLNTPFKQVPEKTAPLVPEAVASVKCIGSAGTDIELKAIVTDESEFSVPDPDQLTFPCLRPIGATTHSMYPGAYVAVTLNLYSYHNGKNPGFSAGANVAVFKADGERIGGGVSVDEDEIFLDD